MDEVLKIIIADDQKSYRDLMSHYLSDFNIQTIGEASNGKVLIQMVEHTTPDVLLLDIEMPEMDGSETLDYLQANFSHIKTIIVTQYDEEEVIKDFFNRGVRAYVPKDSSVETMVKAIYEVKAGKIYKENLPELEIRRKISARKEYYKQLYSRREREIIRLICDGYSNKEMAERLHIAEKTLEGHLSEIYKKSEVETRAQFIVYAIKEGLNYLGGLAYQ